MNESTIESLYTDIKRAAFSLTRTTCDGEDLCHDVIEKLLKVRMPKMTGKGWIYKAVRNRSISEHRTREREARYLCSEVEVSHTGCRESATGKYVLDPPARQTATDDELFDLRLMLSMLKNSLSKSKWVALNLVAEGASYEEIATTMGVSIGTVRSRVHYAREKSKEVLASFLW